MDDHAMIFNHSETQVCCFFYKQTNSSSTIWTKGKLLDNPLSLFAVRILLIFFISRTLHFVLKPFKQPRIVCDVGAGIIAGPTVLGHNEAFSRLMYPHRGAPVQDMAASFGLMYFIFLIGVKMDVGLLKRCGRKAVFISLSSMVVPLLVTSLWSKVIDAREVFWISAGNSLSSFVTITPVLAELKLLNSEIGQIAMSASMLSDAIGWLLLVFIVILRAFSVSAMASCYTVLSISAFAIFILFVIRPMAIWIISRTPPGKPVSEGYIFVFLLSVLVVGFVGDVIGANAYHGALMLGLAIPDGPPLGAALAEKLESSVNGIFMPIFYFMNGSHTDAGAVKENDSFRNLQLLNFLGWLGKVIGTLLPALYFEIPFSDALSLGLVMNVKGIAELVAYNAWRTNQIVDKQAFTIMVLSSLTATALSTPMATSFYKPSRQYIVYKRRTVQHNKPDGELRIVACVHDQAHVPMAIKLLEALHAVPMSPLSIYTLHLVELVGRAAPLVIPHKLERTDSIAHHVSRSDHIINAFLIHEQHHPGLVAVHPFTTIAPYATMHDEVCRLALEKRVSLILVPFHKKRLIGGGIEANSKLRSANHKILLHSPCSVGVIVDTRTTDAGGSAMRTITGEFEFHIALFFFGGEDDREGLAIGGRMASHPGVSLSVTRFLPSRCIREHPVERKLDNQLLEQFRHETAGLENVAYREQLVQDMEEVVGEIRELCETKYDLIIVGMRHRVNSVVSEGGLVEWSDCPELGVIGDFLASTDFGGLFTVLVVKQQDQSGVDSHVPDMDDAVHGQEFSPPARATSLRRQVDY